ncbi:hypothetical protein TUSST3_67410 [Streptomyces sp. TUS-ST3]|nr:hypothetical protein TUSST3_67410 [Streptomyces sp. TUS-ST3]
MDAAGQHLAVPVEVAQHGGGRDGLEHGTHGEALVGAVADGPAGRDVVREDTQPGVVPLLQGAQPGGDTVGGVRGRAGQEGGRTGRTGQQGASGQLSGA